MTPEGGWRGWRNRLLGRPGFQRFAARFPLTRRRTRKDGERLFDLVAGFVYSQILLAVVELDLLALLRDAPRTSAALAHRLGISPQRMDALLQGATALGLLERVGQGYQTAPLGAAALGVPGLAGMIRHHGAFYRDMADPVALLRGEAETELARFWPYVFGASGAVDPAVTARYSDLMAQSQTLVAEETLRAISLAGVRHLMDVGGGTGAFLAEVSRAKPDVALTLFDLPAVVAGAESRLTEAGAGGRVRIVPGSFRDDPLPRGADAISLVRVLYDHADDTVAGLLSGVLDALPPGGLLIVSEPMAGGSAPTRPGDGYFAFYTMAMQTGRARSAAEIGAAMSAAGFAEVRGRPTGRPFVTSVVTGRKPG